MALFRQKWFYGLIGLLALCLLIWLLGPYLSFGGVAPLSSVVGRVIACLLLFSIGGAVLAAAMYRRQQASTGIAAGITADDGSSAPDVGAKAEEAARLRKQFEDAVQALKQTRGRKGAINLYDLPWYVIIGPSGSGKSTVLRNSGLRFPLAERFGHQALRGVAGTRNCDWWFTDEAIFLDTAGRFTTQDSNSAVDREGWRSFLDLLRRYRRRRPINGVLIAISIVDLLTLPADERQAQINSVRARIGELHQQFSMRFPVYVLLTKCDRIPGFIEYFNSKDFSTEEAAQVWGFTFDVEHSRSLQGLQEKLASEFDALVQRLQSQVLRRLQVERDLTRKAALFSFPDQVAAALSIAREFLYDAFAPSAYDEPTFLRGVYLTSGTQEGTPIDRLLGEMARGLGIPARPARSEAKGKAYFITRLLRDVVFPESGLSGVNRRFETQRLWLQRGAYAGAVLFTLCLVATWAVSFYFNRQFVAEVAGVATQFEETRRSADATAAALPAAVPRLDAAARVRDVASTHSANPPWEMRFGLFQGDNLAEAAGSGFQREVESQFMPRLLNALAVELDNPGRDVYAVYEFLRVYLMLGDPSHFDAGDVKAAAALLAQSSGAALSDPGALLRHLDMGLPSAPRPQALAPMVVDRARRRLAAQPVEVFLLNRIKRDYERKETTPVRLLDILGPRGPSLMSRRSGQPLDTPLSPLYTRKGFAEAVLLKGQEKVRALVDEQWVLGESTSLQVLDHLSLFGKLVGVYESEFIRTWDEVLNDLQLERFKGVTDAADKLLVLSATDSPIRTVVSAIAREASLSDVKAMAASAPAAGAGIAATAAAATQAAGQSLATAGRFDDLLDPASSGSGVGPGNQVSQRYRPLIDFARPAAGGQSRLDALLALLGQIQQELATIGAGVGQQTAISAVTRGDLARRLELEAQQLPAPVKQWSLQIAGDIRQVVARGATVEVQKDLGAQVAQPCSQLLAGRYPFVRGGQSDVMLGDFARVFAQGGILDGFFAKNLAAMVDTGTRPWRWRATGTSPINLQAGTLQQFERAVAIRDTYFPVGAQQPKIQFEVRPVQLTGDLSQVLMIIDGQQVAYAHGPIMAQRLEWPGSAGPAEVRIVLTRLDGTQVSDAVPGPWALFKLLDKAGKPGPSPDRVLVSLFAGNSGAVFEFVTSSALNPLQTRLLGEFRCPGGT